MRILASEERLKNSLEGQDWNPRYLVEAKAELERRREGKLEDEKERKRRKEESKERIKRGKEESKERLKRSQGRGPVRPELKKTETETGTGTDSGEERKRKILENWNELSGES